jgi:hypothetical protein
MAKNYSHLYRAIAPTAAQHTRTQGQIQTVQAQLAAHGYDPGTRSGALDHRTRTALAKFQTANAIPVSACVCGQTATALNQPPVGGNQDTYNAGSRKRASGGGNYLGEAGSLLSGVARPINHSGLSPAGGAPGMAPQGMRPPVANRGGSTMSRRTGKAYKSTGFRIPLILSGAIPAAGTLTISVNPQMDFRGENVVVDGTTVGPNCTMTIPVVGTTPQIAGGPASTGVPGTMFSPSQAGALDFKMDISNQGNALATTVVSTLTSTTLNFLALIFGHEVEEDTSAQGSTAGVAGAGSYRG